MNKSAKSFALVISLMILIVFVAGCSSRFVSQPEEGTSPSSSVPSVSRPTNGLVQTDARGGVTIDVEWDRIGNTNLLFNVTMDTHSVDLDQYDLDRLTILRDDTGNEYRPIKWDAAPGGHHRQGTLTFAVPGSLSQGKARYVEMVIRDIAGVKERV